jgi:ribonucleoside-diphosphate reductase alpha chain
MAGASGKKLDETYKLAWIRGLKTTYYLRSLGATHAEKSTVESTELNKVSSSAAAEPASDAKFCAIDKPDCEACQ